MSDDGRPTLCSCGHYEREHVQYEWATGIHCIGHVVAYPADAESDEDGREVPCGCRAMMKAGE